MVVKGRKENNFYNICAHCKTGCCQGVRPPLSSKRKKIILTHLKKQQIPFENPFTRTGYTFPRENGEGYCIFHNLETKKCLIHDVKPETCVAGPVTFDINTGTQKIEWHLKKETVCHLAERLYQDKERLRKHLELAKKEIRKLVKELDAESLRSILKIQEPETFKIGENSVEKQVLNKLV